MKVSSPMETFTMSRKELPGAGLVRAALAGLTIPPSVLLRADQAVG